MKLFLMNSGARVCYSPDEPAAPSPPPPPPAAPAENLYPSREEASPEGETPPADETPSEEAPKEDDPPAEEPPTEEETPPAEIEIKLPETLEVQPELLSEFKQAAKDAGLTSEASQKFADFGVKMLEAQATAVQKAWDDTLTSWKTEIDKDPEIGGSKSEVVQQTLGKVLDQYGSKEAREAFDATGAGWNPHIVKFVYNMAKHLTEGTIVPGGRPAAAPKTTADRLYGNS